MTNKLFADMIIIGRGAPVSEAVWLLMIRGCGDCRSHEKLFLYKSLLYQNILTLFY